MTALRFIDRKLGTHGRTLGTLFQPATSAAMIRPSGIKRLRQLSSKNNTGKSTDAGDIPMLGSVTVAGSFNCDGVVQTCRLGLIEGHLAARVVSRCK
jgi:hypothetical protein